MKTATIICMLFLAGCSSNDDGQMQTKELTKSRVYVYTDTGTGCQYVATVLGAEGLTPRMGADGKQICKARP